MVIWQFLPCYLLKVAGSVHYVCMHTVPSIVRVCCLALALEFALRGFIALSNYALIPPAFRNDMYKNRFLIGFIFFRGSHVG